MTNRIRFWAWPLLTLLILLAGWLAESVLRGQIWSWGLFITGLPVIFTTLRGISQGRFAADITASLAILTAFLLSQPLPGLVVVLMQTGGEALDTWANRRASNAVHSLEARIPRQVHQVSADGTIRDAGLEDVVVGDILLIRPGEIVPCDGVVLEGRPQLDYASLTGEALPVTQNPGDPVRSGGHNLRSPFRMKVQVPAAESEYARLVELVRHASNSKAPLQRIADRYAVWFTPVVIVIAVMAWLAAGDPLRALAVLVVATPCPLILAAPVAVIGGLNQGARQGVIFRHGGALEAMSNISMAVVDKTGTLTIGRPEVVEVLAMNLLPDQVLSLAAAVEQGSGHLLATVVVEEALRRGVSLAEASGVVDQPGHGVSGVVKGLPVMVGSPGWIRQENVAAGTMLESLHPRVPGELISWVVVDGKPAGVIRYADRLRNGIEQLPIRLAELGIEKLALLSGDSHANAVAIAQQVGITQVFGDQTPADKAAFIAEAQGRGERVLMLGDGVNDAPALATAQVGVALASGGGGISAEAADVVIMVDEPLQLIPAIRLSRRALRIARQSILAGLGLSAVGMILAAVGWLTPVEGAVAQEVIDLAVIFNALRVTFPEKNGDSGIIRQG